MNLNRQVLYKECDVHLWKSHLPEVVPSYDCLSKEEQGRSARFRRYEDRARFNKAHTFLKNVLQRYTHLPPEEIQFAHGHNGKPVLKCRHLHPPVYFNLSYRDDYALLAISNSPFIGVDVERIKPIDDILTFTSDYFSPPEEEKILGPLSRAGQLSMVYTFWTMKEALIKALATGFLNPIKEYDLSSFLSKPYQKLRDTHIWHIRRLPIERDYKAAFAVRSEKVNCSVFHYGCKIDQIFF
jgi:4'-phosphopantetheinyl transferase